MLKYTGGGSSGRDRFVTTVSSVDTNRPTAAVVNARTSGSSWSFSWMLRADRLTLWLGKIASHRSSRPKRRLHVDARGSYSGEICSPVRDGFCGGPTPWTLLMLIVTRTLPTGEEQAAKQHGTIKKKKSTRK